MAGRGDDRTMPAQAVLRRPTQTAAFEAVLGQPDGVAARFAPVSPARKQAEVAAVMDDAEVGPAVRGRHQFDPSRLCLARRARRTDRPPAARAVRSDPPAPARLAPLLPARGRLAGVVATLVARKWCNPSRMRGQPRRDGEHHVREGDDG